MREWINNHVPFVHISPWSIWLWLWHTGLDRVRRGESPRGWWYGRFRKRYKGVHNPRRWGWMVLGFDFGCRG